MPWSLLAIKKGGILVERNFVQNIHGAPLKEDAGQEDIYDLNLKLLADVVMW
jgi:hypothetical protein